MVFFAIIAIGNDQSKEYSAYLNHKKYALSPSVSMNTLDGKIIKIDNKDNLSLVSVEVGGVILKSIIIESPDSAPYLKVGNRIKLYFKETEVVLANTLYTDISLRNKLSCRVIDIEKGKLLSRVILNYQNGTISSLITTEACEQLQIVPQCEIIAMIKTNEIMLSND